MEFVLSGFDQDSLFAAKIFASQTDKTVVHLAANRRKMNLDAGANLIFIKPYAPISAFTGSHGSYGSDYNCTILTHASSDLAKDKPVLDAAGVAYQFVDDDLTLAEVAWKMVYGDKPLPYVLELNKDYVKWKRTDEYSTYLHYGLSIVPDVLTKPATEFYRGLLFDSKDGKDLHKVFMDGREIHDYFKVSFKELANELCFPGKLGGMTVLAANVAGVNSSFMEHYDGHLSDYDAVVMFEETHWNDQIAYSVFGVNPDINIGEKLAAIGGSGHPGAGRVVTDRNSPLLEAQYDDHVYDASYDDLANSKEYMAAVDAYIKKFVLAKKWKVSVRKWMGEGMVVLNTPHITHLNIFDTIEPIAGIARGMAYCIRGDGMYRVVVGLLADYEGIGDPGELYGESCGCYRVSVMSAHEFKSKFGD